MKIQSVQSTAEVAASGLRSPTSEVAEARSTEAFRRPMTSDEMLRLIARLEADLNECREYLEGHVDVMDGSDGPRPNRAMQLVSMIDETLNGAGQ